MEELEVMDQITPEMSRAYRAMKALTDWQRTMIFCWFCHECGRHIGPGEKECHHA